MPVEPTPKDVVFRNGTASLYRFRGTGGPNADGPVVLLVPSMINKWYVMDLNEGRSVAAAFLERGFDTFLLDWGVPQDEDRHMTWADAIKKLDRFVRRTCRLRDVEQLGLLGYCMGGTLCSIHVATHPERIAAFANLVGPIDFEHAGLLGDMVNPEWFDVDAISDAGNLPALQMQSGFLAMRPTTEPSKYVALADRWFEPGFRESFKVLEEWADDNIPFPAEAYRTYISELYQQNLLVKGEHWVCGRRADLGNITCPVLTIAASRDHISPEAAVTGLNDHVSSKVNDHILIKGGHVGSVVGSRAAKQLYPQMTDWFAKQLNEAEAAVA